MGKPCLLFLAAEDAPWPPSHMDDDLTAIRRLRAEDRDLAERLQRALAGAGYRLRVRDLSDRYGSSSAIRAGHLEIWLGTDFPARQR